MDNITLPNGAKWDNKKTLHEQEMEAMQYVQDMLDNIQPVEQCDEFNRPILVIWEDNLVRVQQHTTYKNPGNHRFSWEPLTSSITVKLQ
jgi:hypothetical protein